MKRTLSLALAALLLLSISAGCAGSAAGPGDVPAGAPGTTPGDIVSDTPTYSPADADAPRYAKDYSEIAEHLGAGYRYYEEADYATVNVPMESVTVEESAVEAPAADAPAPEPDASEDYSGTNVQVEGIDEGDIVKTDGKYIYILHGGCLIIYEAAGEDTRRLGSIALGHNEEISEAEGYEYYYEYSDKSPVEMYVSGSTVIVISSGYHSVDWSIEKTWNYEYTDESCIDFIDVSDPSSPALTSTVSQDGYVNTSRLYDGKLYLISNYYVHDINEDEPETYIPGIKINSTKTLLEPDRIAVIPDCYSSRYSVIGVYDAENGALSRAESLLGSGDTIYMSTGGIYFADSEYYEDASGERTESVYKVTDYVSGSRTRITRYDISGGSIALAASGTIPGYLNDQFSMDEYNGYLRVVTTVSTSSYSVYVDDEHNFTNYVWGDSTSFNGLYILDSSLSTIGKADGLAENETVYSARFDGDIAYFVTFRQTDPLFAVDLSDPTSPKVLSALKIPGFSEYLHVWSEGRLFGLGMNADEETGWTENMKLSMFDTSDPANVLEKCTLNLDCSWSEALYNHKAILISAEKNIIGFPAGGSYLIYGYTDGGGFVKRAEIECENDSWYGARGLYIGDYAYIIGDTITVLDMTGFTLVTTISID